MVAPLSGDRLGEHRNDVASRLLGYLGSQENIAARLSKSHSVFAAIGLQRNIISYLASGKRPLACVAGPEGSGKSSLLSAVERRARELFPLLSVHTSYGSPGVSGHNRSVRFLRELWHAHSSSEEADALNPNELLHNGACFLTRASTEIGGLLLIIDDIDEMHAGCVPNWLPHPLPPGLHCIASTSSEEAITKSYAIRPGEAYMQRLGGLSVLEQQYFVSLYAPRHQELAWSALSGLASRGQSISARACCLLASFVAEKPDSNPMQFGEDAQAEMALAYMYVCEKQYGDRALRVMVLLAYAHHGLFLNDLVALCNLIGEANKSLLSDGAEKKITREHIALILEFCKPLFRDSPQVYCLGGDFALRAVRALCSNCGVDFELIENEVRLCLLTYFVSVATTTERTTAEGFEHGIEEAAAQLAKANAFSLGEPLRFVTCLPVLRHFARRPDELVELWRKVGVDHTGKMLVLAVAHNSWTTNDRCLAGRLLSRAGEFAAARELLNVTLSLMADPVFYTRDSQSALSAADCNRAEVLVAIASNEVRYWDSRRDWASPEALRLLLESSNEAVELLGRHSLRSPAEKLMLASALSRRANGCFKAGCVSAFGSNPQKSYFDEADGHISRAVSLLQGQQVQVLGESVLVGGVTTLCRAHSLIGQNMEAEALEKTISAMLQFYRAEAILRLSVGSINEKSIYTNGNLAELLLNNLRQPVLGLLHHRLSCIVAVRVFGSAHANANRKLQEMAHICQQLTWNDFVEYLQEGRPEEICSTAIDERLRRLGVSSQGPHHELIATALADEVDSAVYNNSSATATPEFWEGLWRDLGVPHRSYRLAS